jgi:neprilysin
MERQSLLKRQFVMIISAILLCSSLVAIYANNDIIVDDNNHLKLINESETKTESECIPTTYLEQSETEKFGNEKHIEEVTTSFKPSYCKIKPKNSKDDLLTSEVVLKRVKRHSLKNLLNYDSLGNLTKLQIRSAQAEMMKKFMDTSINPCEDFYSYACGNWALHNKMPKDKVILDTFEILRESIDETLKNLLTSDEKEDQVTTKYQTKKTGKDHQRRRNAELKAKNLFKSCMNYELIEKRGIEPLLELLRKFGGWPLLDDDTFDSKSFDWLQLTATLRRYNNDILIVEWVGSDIQNSSHQIVQFDQTTLGLPLRDYFIKESNQKYLNSYRTFMMKVIHLIGAKNAEKHADEIISFEKKLAEIMIPHEDRTNISVFYQKMSLKKLTEEIPEIDWIRYLTIVQGRAIDPEEKVILFAKSYMKDLVKLIELSEPSTVANYLLWRFVRHRINNLDNRFLEAKQTFYHECFGREKSPPRWKSCVTQVNSNMGMATGALFVKKYFDENSKIDTVTMVHALQDGFRKILDNTDWIDSRTKKLAKQKLAAMSLKIGYPDYILSQSKLDERYIDLQINPDKYFENTLNVLQYLSREEQKKVGKPVNKTIWQTYPAVVNAFYSRSKNQIMFPAGILQPPFYHHHFPKALNFGGIGVVIGHEMTHG